MCKPTPISDAVQKALDAKGPLELSIKLNENRPRLVHDIELMYTFGRWSTEYRADGLVHTGLTDKARADAADALCALADRLDPDVQAKALEIAAKILSIRGCPIGYCTTWDGCATDADGGLICGPVREREEQRETCWLKWLQQTRERFREFFADQAAQQTNDGKDD